MFPIRCLFSLNRELFLGKIFLIHNLELFLFIIPSEFVVLGIIAIRIKSTDVLLINLTFR